MVPIDQQVLSDSVRVVGVEPVDIVDGLAAYRRGTGPPVLVMPYPHASTSGPMAGGPLAEACIESGFEVISFDLPGCGRSTRPRRSGLDEMIECADEVRERQVPESAIRVVGHSMSALCAFMYALRRPAAVERLALVGTPPGSGLSLVTARSVPFNWPPWNLDFWRGVVWGSLLAAGRGSLAMHKRRDHLWDVASFVDQRFVPDPGLEPGDERRPPPPRDDWWVTIRKLRLMPLAADLRVPTLLMVGRHDPQTPLRVSVDLQRRIPDAQLAVFERSGHSPFIEEPDRFRRALGVFLG